MKEFSTKVGAYYDENTESFYLDLWHSDEIHFGWFFPVEELVMDARLFDIGVKRMTDVTLKPAAISAADVLLDVGCGVGGPAIRVAKETGCQVTGLTISARQVELARARAESAGLGDRVRFERADAASHLPAADGSVDVIMCIESACYYDDRPQFLSECARVLKPGGRLVLSDWLAREGGESPERGQQIADVCDAWIMPNLETLKGYQAMLVGAGLEVVELVDMHESTLANARIVEQGYERLRDAENLNPQQLSWRRQLQTLARAWLAGHFTLGRLFARKPESGDPRARLEETA